MFTPPPTSARPHCEAVAHSFSLTHVAVSPDPDSTNPAPQEHVYPPVASVQALTLPPVSERPHCAAVAHSSTFTHVAESPEPESTKPGAQPHV
jgi:hypothetical protein